MNRFAYPVVMCMLSWAVVLSADAQDGVSASSTDNARIEYAHVLRVEPVYKTVHAIREEQVCDSEPVSAAPPLETDTPIRTEGTFVRMLGSIKGFFSSPNETAVESAVAAEPLPPRAVNCREVQVERELRQVVAYDVDYIHRGVKYRSRLPEDPGNRVRLRVSITPDYPVAQRERLLD